MNEESADLMRQIAAMEFDPVPVADAAMLAELVSPARLGERLRRTGDVMRLAAYLVTRQKPELVKAMETLALDAIEASDQLRIQAEWLRYTANIIDAAGARLMTAAAAFSVEAEQDQGEASPAPWPANDDGGGDPAA